MGNTVTLIVTAGPMKGKQFAFEEHDTFIFGRLEECHCCLPDDSQVSRRHFIIEVNPPDARIRDFGSLNGTYLNDKKIGSREKGETPEQGQKRKYTEVDLRDGDVLKVGQSFLAVKIEAEQAKGPLLCSQCGKDVAGEVGGKKLGAYICLACRQSMEVDPAQILLDMLAKAEGKPASKDGLPVIAGFRIVKRIGIGGFGAVYLAERETDKQKVAIKVMLARVAVDDDARQKFMQEINLLKDLQHEHIVTLFDSGAVGGAFYFVMELCPGGSVADYMAAKGGTLPVAMVLPIMVQALKGLAFAHSKGVVHRDLKPSNILLSGTPSKPQAKIADLGLAKNFDKAGFSGMTVTGAFAGTPIYMPKEQITNFKYVKPVTDVWSIGATFYNMLTGQTPRDFPRGSDPMEIILRGEIIPIRKRDNRITRELAEVIDKAIQASPKDRYQDAQEMLAALNNVES
ncbi:MAG: protein kinase [Lentisphaerae bacterium]|nr:protein kinase [Lentisphaerota bacterium]